jgi:hypothetical protein
MAHSAVESPISAPAATSRKSSRFPPDRHLHPGLLQGLVDAEPIQLLDVPADE